MACVSRTSAAAPRIDTTQDTFTEVGNHAKTSFDMVKLGKVVRVLRNDQSAVDIVLVLLDFHHGSDANSCVGLHF